jgi:urea carboxylase-associated protein 2
MPIASPSLPVGLAHTETLRGGQAWSRVVPRHHTLRLTAAADGAAVAVLLYNARQPLERYNMPDTLKAQHTAFITAGRALHSDFGHVLAGVTADSCGWHDTVTGHQDAAGSLARFGAGTYQELRNDRHRNSRDNLLVELAKHGLGLRDLHANLNLFVKVAADADGRLAWVGGHARAGMLCELRMEMDVLVVLSNTPHHFDPATTYAPPAVELAIRPVSAPGPDDACRVSRPENGRGYQRTEALFAAGAASVADRSAP